MPYDLQRFLDAQAQTYDQALAELRDGAKRTHWMWFVFPQIEGLGRSGMAQRYAIRDPPWLEPWSCAGPNRSRPSTRAPRAARCAAAALPMPPSPITITS